MNIHHSPHSAPSSLRIRTTSTTTSTTTTTSYHHQRRSERPSLPVSHSSLAGRQTLPIDLTPLLTLAAYGSLIITALSALIGIGLASYGLSAWGDFKEKFVGARASIAHRFVLRPHLAAPAPSPLAGHGHDPTRPILRRAGSSRVRHWGAGAELGRSAEQTDARGEYEARQDEREAGEGTHGWRRSHERPRAAPQRPTLSVLVASIFFTLVVVIGRLMVAWWLGQQTKNNQSQAFRNAQRAYQAAQIPPPPALPPSSRRRAKLADRSYSHPC